MYTIEKTTDQTIEYFTFGNLSDATRFAENKLGASILTDGKLWLVAGQNATAVLRTIGYTEMGYCDVCDTDLPISSIRDGLCPNCQREQAFLFLQVDIEDRIIESIECYRIGISLDLDNELARLEYMLFCAIHQVSCSFKL